MFLVLPCVTINRPGPDTELLVGQYGVDWTEDSPQIKYCGLGDDPGVFLGNEFQRVDEAVAEIVGQRHLVGGDDGAIRILDAHIAFCGERVGAAVIDHLIGE